MRISDWSSDVCSSDLGCKADGFGMEIAPGNHVAITKHQRIVGRSVGLDQQNLPRVTQLVEAGADHLRGAAQTIGVLHAQIVLTVTFADLRTFEQGADRARDRKSTRLNSSH